MENLERIIAELNARDRIRQKGREEMALGVVWFGTVRLRRFGDELSRFVLVKRTPYTCSIG